MVGARTGWTLYRPGPRWVLRRRLGLVALVGIAVADALLTMQALNRGSGPTAAALTPVVPIGTAPPSTRAPQAGATGVAFAPGAEPAAVTSYGDCRNGSVRIGGKTLGGVTQVLALTGTRGTAAMLARDRDCAATVLTRTRQRSWQPVRTVTAPTAAVGASASAIWAFGARDGVVVDVTGAVVARPRTPCAASFAPTALAVWTPSKATLVCTGTTVRQGELRLLYGTTDQGKTWSELAGARAATGGRRDGLDRDGRIVSAAALGTSGDFAVLLGSTTCTGLQLRLSSDSGRNWKVGGCLPEDVAGPVAIAGTAARITVATPSVRYVSRDRGKTWRST